MTNKRKKAQWHYPVVRHKKGWAIQNSDSTMLFGPVVWGEKWKAEVYRQTILRRQGDF